MHAERNLGNEGSIAVWHLHQKYPHRLSLCLGIWHVSTSHLHNLSSSTVGNLRSNRDLHILEDYAVCYGMMWDTAVVRMV